MSENKKKYMAKELITLKDYEKTGKEALNRIVAYHDEMEGKTVDVDLIVPQVDKNIKEAPKKLRAN